MPQSQKTIEADRLVNLKVSAGYDKFRRVWFEVRGKAEAAGQAVEIWDGERSLGQARFTEDSDGSTARLEATMQPIGQPFGLLTLRMDGKTVSHIELPDADEERMKAFLSVELHFEPYVFSGTEFPPCDFEQPSMVEDLIGRYTLRVNFYDGDFQPVETAEATGRFGAVVEIEASDGRVFKRFRTLYRKPGPVNPWNPRPSRPRVRMSQPMPIWYGPTGPFPLDLPEKLGIDPEVVHEQGTTLFEYLRGRFAYAIWDDPWTPVLLAGLHETKPGDGDLRRNNAWERDRRWWVELKRRTGNLRLPHLLYLPDGYDADSEKRWPLVLFLHGSDEIGSDLDQVRKSGLAKLAEEGRKFPFILVAPQSPEEEWFWLAAAQDALLDQICTEYRVDPDRIYVTGLSMGGRGTWVQAIEYPDRFAAIAPICGSIPEPEETARISHVPVWAYVGAHDEDQSIQKMVEAHGAAGGDSRLTVYPDAGHDAWTLTYANPEFYDWLLGHRRTPASN